MRKLLVTCRRWKDSKWTTITVFEDLETGHVYRHVEDFTPKYTPLEDYPTGTPVDKNKYMAVFQPGWRRFEGSCDDPHIFIKKVCFTDEEELAKWERQTWERELQAFHTPGFPHPNIVEFHGCVVENGYVAGMAVTRLPKSLKDIGAPFWEQYQGCASVPAQVTADGIPFDHDTVMEGVRPALDHLKSLNLVYLDLKPDNIMWIPEGSFPSNHAGQKGRWGLIDFGDVYPAGQHFEYPPGTYGWQSEKGGVAEDLFSFSVAILTTWLKTGETMALRPELIAGEAGFKAIMSEAQKERARAVQRDSTFDSQEKKSSLT